MSRREVIAQFKAGGIKAVIDASGPALTWMKPRERNAMVASSLGFAGNMWLEKYLPLRFTNYAYRLGYQVSESWKKRKRRELHSNARPFIGLTPRGGGTFESDVGGGRLAVTNGEKMAVAVVRTAKSRATRTSNNFKIIITMGYGHPIRPNLADAFKQTPSSELKAVAQETQAKILLFLQGANKVDRQGKPRIDPYPTKTSKSRSVRGSTKRKVK